MWAGMGVMVSVSVLALRTGWWGVVLAVVLLLLGLREGGKEAYRTWLVADCSVRMECEGGRGGFCVGV
jgi:uncharacterized membrane protein